MTQETRRLYPAGIQTFPKIREGNYLYVDKTEEVYKITHSSSSYIFLSHPVALANHYSANRQRRFFRRGLLPKSFAE